MDNKQLQYININNIIPNTTQPRTFFDDDAINELAESIKENGLIQPIVVRPIDNDKYEIVAGERRYRACHRALLENVPCIIQNYDDMHLAQVALIENIQREDLTPIEEAKAYKMMLEEYNLTQTQIAEQVGKKQSTIANKLRLLNLPIEIQDALLERKITERHARALLSVEDSKTQISTMKKIIDKGLTVKQTEELVNKGPKQKKPKANVVKGYTKNVKIALNTLARSFDMIRKVGIDVDTSESEDDTYFYLTVKIKK